MSRIGALMPWILLAFAILSGCASLGPKRVEQRESIRSSSTSVVETVGELSPIAARWHDGALHARATRPVTCVPVLEQEVAVSHYEVRPARHLGLSIATSTLALAGGIVLGLAWVPMASQPEYVNAPQDQFTAADAVLVSAGIGVLGGLYGLYQARDVYKASRPVPTGETQVAKRVEPTGPQTDCQSQPVPVTVSLPHTQRRFEGGEVKLDFVGDAALCPASFIDQEAVIQWEAGGESGELWRGSLSDCARTHRAQALLGDVAGLVSGTPTPEEISKSSEAFDEARRLLETVDPSYPGRDELVGQAAALESTLRAGAAGALETSLAQLERLAPVGAFPDVFASGQAAIATSKLVEGAFAQTWVSVHEMYAANVTRPQDIALVMTADPHMARCVVNEDCEEGLDPHAARLIYVPIVQSAQAAMAASAARVLQSASDDPISVAEGRLEGERFLSSWCDHLTWTDDITRSCRELVEARKRAWVVLSKREQAELQASLKQTARAWRANFATCRKVKRGIESLQGIRQSECGSECQRAIARLQADYDELASFRLENPQWSDETLKDVRIECQEARCPTCP